MITQDIADLAIQPRLFHFSDDPAILCFRPRPVRVPARRALGRDWLNGPLVWAIDDDHQPLYLFPRDCPRILIWPTADTTSNDLARWWDDPGARMVAYIEDAWLDRFASATICRYELPPVTFESLHDAGAWVSRTEVSPLRVETLTDLRAELARHNVVLRSLETLIPLRTL